MDMLNFFMILSVLDIEMLDEYGKDRLMIDLFDELQGKWDRLTITDKEVMGFHHAAIEFCDDIVEKFRIVQDKMSEHKTLSRHELNDLVLGAIQQMSMES